MFRKYRLKPQTVHDTELEFEWDSDSGVVRGRDAARVAELVADANRVGTIVGHPYPTVFEVSDPLRNPDELALVLGQYWQLPEDLARNYPKAPADEVPEGAVY
jgi:hypothetical protein